MYDKLVAKVNNFDNIDNDTSKSGLEKKIPDTRRLVKKKQIKKLKLLKWRGKYLVLVI